MAIDPSIISEVDFCSILASYKTSVCENYAQIKLLNFVDEIQREKELVDIDRIYVDLMCEPFSNFDLGYVDSGSINPCSEALVVSENDAERRAKLNMVVLGLPGAGKTTLLKYLLKQYSKQSKVVPIYIELKSEIESDFSDVLSKGRRVVLSDILTYLKDYFEATVRVGGAGDRNRELCLLAQKSIEKFLAEQDLNCSVTLD